MTQTKNQTLFLFFFPKKKTERYFENFNKI
jgi:hypothetical protein